MNGRSSLQGAHTALYVNATSVSGRTGFANFQCCLRRFPHLSLMVLVPLPDTKATLMLSLCALSQANPHILILLRSSIKTGTFILFNLYSALIPFPTLKAATQHTNTITRLKNCSLRNPDRNNKVTLHVTFIGVAGTIYNDYTIQPLTNLGINQEKSQGLLGGGGGAGRVAVKSGRRRIRASRSMADNPPEPN
eukprot:1141580-Pelagomonas_calceolata.AAC.2